ncbi:hypothetical protein [Clostridium estertheticum]|uniref:hypothetical protein n=1 Tax=Clostridium estertheticum TaxID=238834 RepID=UPI001CF0F49D|nr:hypothetical protein [Clostridium estertheticum]MCB2355756.1 hypothetical protein [Clostridium estertheticum]WAG39344.1 hypothetical protein LL065_13630 [Clostridium estertheticum]
MAGVVAIGAYFVKVTPINYDASKALEEKVNNKYTAEYIYNADGKLIAVLDPVSKEKGLSYSVKYAYDTLGRNIKR